MSKPTRFRMCGAGGLILSAAWVVSSMAASSARAQDAGAPATAAPAAPAAAPAGQAASNGVPGLDTFRLLTDRNIFNSTRSGPPDPNAPTPEPEYHPRTLRLMGTVLRDDLALALFEGDGVAPVGGAKQGDAVAGYTVASIRTQGITLTGDGGPVELTVGAGLSEQKDGRWVAVDAGSAALPAPAPMPEPEATPAAPSEPSAAPAAEPQAAGEEAGRRRGGPKRAESESSSDDPAEKMRARRRREMGK